MTGMTNSSTNPLAMTAATTPATDSITAFMNPSNRIRGAARSLLMPLLLGMALCSSARALPVLSLSSPVLATAAGQGFTLDLMVSGVDQGIGGWSVGLTVGDVGVAAFTGISFSGALGLVGSEALGFGDAPAGTAPAGGATRRFDFGAASLLSVADLGGLQGTSFRLATLSFTALAEGATQLTLIAPVIGAVFSDAAGNAVDAASLEGTDVHVSAALPPVSPVPEPSSAAFLAAGLACLGLVGRVRRPG